MRVVFLGSPAFAVPSLRALAAHPDIDVPLVVTQPDRPAGRGRTLTPPAVKVAALELGLPVYQPESLREIESAEPLVAASPDVLIVVAYGELLRKHVLNLAPHGCLNVHPSLLPRYRGAAPIPAAILNGDDVTGVSIMRLVRKLDAGPVLAQHEVDIRPGETTASLSERLASIAAEMLPSVARAWTRGEVGAHEQDEAGVTHTREWKTDDARIDWSQSAASIERLIRAANPWPVAWTLLDGERFRIHGASLVDTAFVDSPPGTVFQSDKAVHVVTGDGSLRLDTVQGAGKRAMSGLDWWRGLRRDQVVFDSPAPRES